MQIPTQYQLHDFQIIETIGQGSFSKVKLVKRINDGKILALKQVSMDKLGVNEKNSALNQIRLLASIKSPFVISYEGSFYSSNTNSLCLLMQYAQNGDLETIINKAAKKNKMQKGLPQNFIWKTIIHLLQGLKILHQSKIVHRDIKPANIFYNKNIAKIGDLNVSSVSNSQFYSTKTGTPYYTAPQIWKGQKYTTNCDIWSLGCIIYQMCALVPPFRAQTFPELFVAVSRGDYTTLSQEYSDDIRTFVRMCLVTQQSERFSAAQLLSGPIIVKQLSQFKDQINLNSKVDLIKPLKCPKVLRFINQILPQVNSNQDQVYSINISKVDVQKKRVKIQQTGQKRYRVPSIAKQSKALHSNNSVKSTIRIKSYNNIKNQIHEPKSVKVIKCISIYDRTQEKEKQQKESQLQLKQNKNSLADQKRPKTTNNKNNNFRLRSYKKIIEKQKQNVSNF